LRAQFETRLGALERANRELQEAFVESTRAVADTFNQLGSQRIDQSHEQRDEIRELKIEVAKRASGTHRGSAICIRAGPSGSSPETPLHERGWRILYHKPVT
jgi:hypothetical protein